jgi:hypothetical protein
MMLEKPEILDDTSESSILGVESMVATSPEWQVALQFNAQPPNPLYPPATIVRVVVTECMDPSKIYFSVDYPVTTTSCTFPVGPGTPVLPGKYALRAYGIAATGTVSDQYSVLLDVVDPSPVTPTLISVPTIQLIPPPAVTAGT